MPTLLGWRSMSAVHAFGGCRLLASAGKALCGGQIDVGEILNLFGGFAADDELLGYVLSKRHIAKRDCASPANAKPTLRSFILSP
jgi:hypothetical protein